MKLLTFYTKTHLEIFEKYFLESFNEFLKEDFELIESFYEQICLDGSYGSQGFNETMIGKIEHIVKNIDINDPNPLIYADCDIQFFSNIKNDVLEQIKDYDIKFQDDINCICAGFFVCKQNNKILSFFNEVLKSLKDLTSLGYDDQRIINNLLPRNKYNISYDKLPVEKYFTVAASNNAKQWNGESFEVPKNVIVHHANWTVGVENKKKLLDYVRNNR